MGPSKFITFLITDLAYGGAETQLVRLARALKSRGWDAQIISMLQPTAFIEELASTGIPLISLRMRRGVPDPRGVVRLLGFLQERKPHILVSFLFHANVLGRVVGWLAGVPLIVSSFRNEKFGGRGREWAIRLTNWMATADTANSTLAADSLAKRGVVAPARLRVIPNGIVTDDFVVGESDSKTVRYDLGLTKSEFMWLAVGRLDQQKDYLTLLKALRLLQGDHPRTVLIIAGEGRELTTLKQQTMTLGLTDGVAFLGLRGDIAQLLAAADGFVLSSAWEGLPNVVMEAMAAARPVVATRVGGVPELVEEGVNGFLVPTGRPEGLAAAMRTMMDLPESVRREMGQAGRVRIEANFGLDSVVDRWEELFVGLLDRKGMLRGVE